MNRVVCGPEDEMSSSGPFFFLGFCGKIAPRKRKRIVDMYYYEKDYIMRLIHGIALVLARLLLGRQMEEEGEISSVLGREEKEKNDYLLKMIDEGQINEAEEILFDLLETPPGTTNRKPSWPSASMTM